MNNFTIGQRVYWKGAGTVHRLEGYEGRPVTGIVRRLPDKDGFMGVLADHRTLPGGKFENMGTHIAAADVKPLDDDTEKIIRTMRTLYDLRDSLDGSLERLWTTL
jgi:hypothetical protein